MAYFYIYGIRTIGDWVTSRYGLRAGVVEALLILALALAAAPMRSWLAQRFHRLFEREAALYRQIVSRISLHAGRYQQLPDLLDFVEQQTTSALKLRRVRILVDYRRGAPGIEERQPNNRNGRDSEGDAVDASSVKAYASTEAWVEQVLDLSSRDGWSPVEGDPVLEAHGYTIAYPLRRDGKRFRRAAGRRVFGEFDGGRSFGAGNTCRTSGDSD